ncbi:diglucosylglycerate octanoyltransferase [Rhodococcus sp. 1168]|uniref:diglucosylglycerate octanoyltransferase n=1 Tax=Rhodococcus sp. 1168 TaxID=2018041 RepID=UPI000A0BE451|nr:diglucosylglycerate octanoyltransferase [Rhodococcus sp. 1168]ORI17227.1 lysophospholipase [Rhodococcus sp. 1168]
MTSSDDYAPPAAEKDAPPVLLVLADSLSYFGPKGGLPVDDPRIWPNLVAAELGWRVELVARIGWTSRDVWWALTQDPRVWAAIPKAGAVVFGVGGMDSLPSPLPTALREQIRYVRPPALRRVVRAGYQWVQPRFAHLRWPVALPPKLSVDYLEQARAALAYVRPELPVIGTLPSVHRSDAYGKVHAGRPAAERALRTWSESTGVPLVDLAEAVRENIYSDNANPDGIHWGWDAHVAVAEAMLVELRKTQATAP